MVKKKEQELKFITEDEIEEKIKNHLLVLRWEKKLDNDFSWYNFTNWIKWKNTKDEKEYNIDCRIFEDRNLESSNFSNSTFWEWINSIWYDESFSFKNSNLKEVNFKNSKIKNVNFSFANLEWADIRWAEYNTNTFSKEQLATMILTDIDFEKYQKKKLEKENKELKKDVTEKIEVIKNTSEKQTNLLTQSFEKLEKQFLLEEKRWLVISFILFTCLLFFFSIPILDIFMYWYTYKIIFWGIIVIIWLIFWTTAMLSSLDLDDIELKNEKIWFFKELWFIFKSWWGIIIYILLVIFLLNNLLNKVWIPEKSVFNLETKYALIPLWILLSTFLYFSIYQYSKSKKLRIENSNKIALLHWFSAIRADTWKDIDKWRFYDNVANVVFDKVYPDKEINLPIDKIIDLAKIINK